MPNQVKIERSIKITAYGNLTVQQLRAVLDQVPEDQEDARVDLVAYVGDQREQGYTTITIRWDQ